MPARRAVSFWLNPCASIRSHRARGSTVGRSAASILTGAPNSASTFAWTAGLMCFWPRDTWVM